MNFSTVLATDLLVTRESCNPNYCNALRKSAEPLAAESNDQFAVCQELVKRAVDICPSAQSAGASIFAGERRDELSWLVVEGRISEFEGRKFGRRHSMCGVCFDRRALQLFVQPHRYFRWLATADIFIQEALVCPLFGSDKNIYGTFWMFSHDTHAAPFTQCDARILTQLGALARPAVQTGCVSARSAHAYVAVPEAYYAVERRRRLPDRPRYQVPRSGMRRTEDP